MPLGAPTWGVDKQGSTGFDRVRHPDPARAEGIPGQNVEACDFLAIDYSIFVCPTC